jgi:hypothetical protein
MARALPATLGPDVLPRSELRALVLDGVLWPLDRTFHSIDEPDRPGLRADALFRSFLFDLSRRRDTSTHGNAAHRTAAPGGAAPGGATHGGAMHGGAMHGVAVRRAATRMAARRRRVAAVSVAGDDMAFVAGGLSAAWVHGAILNPPPEHEILAWAPARVPVPPLPGDWRVTQAQVRDVDVCRRGGWPVLSELATALALAKGLVSARGRARAHSGGAVRAVAGGGAPRSLAARASCDARMRTAALVAIVRLAGLDTVQDHLATAQPRRGTQAHDATELIRRIARNLAADDLAADDLAAARRERELERVRERERRRHLEYTREYDQDAEREYKRRDTRESATEAECEHMPEIDDEKPRLTEQKRLTPLPDPRTYGPPQPGPQELPLERLREEARHDSD